MNEATARLKINKLLEAADWRFFAVGKAPANICLELSVKIKESELNALGENFEKMANGFIDFLLLNEKGFPFIVLEAKAEDKNPLVGKEQARKYARSQNCRFVILSNGNLHYFWDLERGNPYIITSFPTPDSAVGYQKVSPNPERLIKERVSQLPVDLQDQQGSCLRDGWHDDHGIRLHRHSQSRNVSTDFLADRFHPDQGARHPQAQLPRPAL
jgi:type I restriction enzyme R subunit